jgi:hypothetical protein
MADKTDFGEIQKKLDKGEKLSDDETYAVMAMTPDEEEALKYGDKPSEEDIDEAFDESIDVDKKNKGNKEDEEETEDAEETGEEKGDESGEEDKEKVEDEKPKQPKDDTPADVGERQELNIDRLNEELEKAPGQEDLKSFSKKEQAYFWQMRRDRQARQKAELEKDELRRELLRVKTSTQKTEDTTPGEHEPDDFVTFKDLQKLGKEKTAEPQVQSGGDVFRNHAIAMWEKEAAGMYSDYQEVSACAEDIVANSTVYQNQVLESLQRGENPAVFMYHLIKSDPDFESVLPKARMRLAPRAAAAKANTEAANKQKTDTAKIEKAKIVEEKINKNTKKPKTSGHYSGSEAETDKFPSVEDVVSMSDAEFAALPKAKRDALLKKYGA